MTGLAILRAREPQNLQFSDKPALRFGAQLGIH